MHSYLTSQLAEQLHRDRLAEQRQAQVVALARSSRRAQPTPERRLRWAVRNVLWLRSQPQR